MLSLKKNFSIFVCAFMLTTQCANENFFNDTLLIINYNFAHYQSIEFLKELYRPYFPHIVFYGPSPHNEVNLCNHHEGWFQYKILAHAMEKYPQFSGYLITNDDNVINPWNFTRFDKNKIWFSPTSPLLLVPNATTSWGWWQKPVGYQAMLNSYNAFAKKYKDTLKQNCDNQVAVLMGMSDIAYIPARYKNEVIELCNIFIQHNTFLEIALPTLCACISNKNDWEIFNDVVLWGDNRRNARKFYNKSIDYIHPFKFSSLETQKFIKDQFIQ